MLFKRWKRVEHVEHEKKLMRHIYWVQDTETAFIQQKER
jgi:hypothetical protein